MGWLTERFRDGAARCLGPTADHVRHRRPADLHEETLDHLEGYRGSAPVRVGNGAADQLQLDIYGELMDSVYLSTSTASRSTHDGWETLCRLIEWVCDNWDQADEGIWEVRGGRQNFTYSRLMSWVAVERAIRIAQPARACLPTRSWDAARDAIYYQIMEHGWNDERKAFVQHYGTDVLDASVLLMPLVKFIAPTDPRWLSTLDAISTELVSDSPRLPLQHPALSGRAPRRRGHVLDLLLLVRGGARAGRRLDEARLAFEKMLTYANHLGPLLGGDRPDRRAARQLSAGVHASRADQRGGEPRSAARLGKERSDAQRPRRRRQAAKSSRRSRRIRKPREGGVRSGRAAGAGREGSPSPAGLGERRRGAVGGLLDTPASPSAARRVAPCALSSMARERPRRDRAGRRLADMAGPRRGERVHPHVGEQVDALARWAGARGAL